MSSLAVSSEMQSRSRTRWNNKTILQATLCIHPSTRNLSARRVRVSTTVMLSSSRPVENLDQLWVMERNAWSVWQVSPRQLDLIST